jgi:peptidoglycan/LPS O-acetylase OafA/YrhL
MPSKTTTNWAQPPAAQAAWEFPPWGRLAYVDGVRAIAILAVIGFHARLPGFRGGFVGVDVFFVISGFLISHQIASQLLTGRFSAMDFYARRVLRIFPLYYLLLVTLAFVVPLFGPVPPLLRAEPGAMPLAWVYLSNWTLDPPAPIGHCWSLAVEEQFYLLWPLVVAALSAQRLLRFCVVVAVVALGFRIGVRAFGFPPEIAYENTLARMDALALGAAGAVLLRDPAAVGWLAPKLRPALLVAALAVLASAAFGMARTGQVTQIAGYSLLAVFFALLIAAGVIQQARGGDRLSRALSSRPLRLFGKYSYAIYIIHLPLHIFVSKVLLADQVAFRGSGGRYIAIQIAYAIAMTGVLLGLAVLSYHLYEKHFLRLKRYF